MKKFRLFLIKPLHAGVFPAFCVPMRSTTGSVQTRKNPATPDSAPVAFAKRAQLTYVSDSQAGITRTKKGKGFSYRLNGKSVTDAETLKRIRSLVIPPAWKNVWICANPDGHLQATGYDVRGRKQYRYHSKWSASRNETKFDRLNDFGQALEKIRARVKKDLSLPGLPLNKVLATVITLMDMTGIRIGSSEYEKLYGSYGLTTMKDKHVNINGSQVRFTFKGKKGVHHEITLHDKKLAKIVKQCRDIPGSELFQYRDEQGVRHTVDSGMVNAYIHEIGGADFTSKDFRTWNGTVHAFTTLREMAGETGCAVTGKQLLAMFDAVAKKLGNTRAVCKKYYVHPGIVQLHESNQLTKLNTGKGVIRGLKHLDATEQQLICVLQKIAA
jgi:DNA topoisomerase-1